MKNQVVDTRDVYVCVHTILLLLSLLLSSRFAYGDAARIITRTDPLQPFCGAVLITLVVLLIQIGVVRILQRKRLAWALTFVPSALCLIMLTNIGVSPDSGTLAFGVWRYIAPVLIVVFS